MFGYRDFKFDETKLKKMQNRIYELEREYYKTRKFTHFEMRKEIRKIIEEEYRKNIGG